MSNELELVADEEGLAVVGNATDVERFFLSAGLDHLPSRDLDLQRLRSLTNTAGTAVGVAGDVAANSGRWVKLTADSAKAMHEFGLMAVKDGPPGVRHAMVGQPGDIGRWLQIDQASTMLLSGPFALTALSTMMQQRAMQEQMDAIVEYLQEVSEKLDDVLRAQKDAVLADMIGVDLVIEEALTVRDRVGRVSDVTWSKVQGTSMTLARTQAYALRQLDAIAEKLASKADLGEVAKATRDAEPRVREWLAVLARTFQLQQGTSVLELDRVLDGAPEDLESHRAGLRAAREKRLELIARTTGTLLAQMEATVQRANGKVLLNPFDAPAAVKSSNSVAVRVIELRGRLGIETGHDSKDAKRWREAAAEAGERVLATATESANAATRFGTSTIDRATEAFRAVDIDGDGVPDKPRAAAVAEEAGAAIKGAAGGVASAFGTLFGRKSGGAHKAPADDDEA